MPSSPEAADFLGAVLQLQHCSVIVDTNFINFSIKNKLDLEKGMMDCLYAKWSQHEAKKRAENIQSRNI
ncbi:hypothetical protein EJB05_51992 [Eragrostis curvula]|uniref:PIN domain-containing protein n=1 Tax=Eragrostis curvula TaxID=38414 RepID=A0A5J9SUC5_9POAL|nr:hypothetical protein EJB05_51992 [Eragrostis curvula]